MSVRLVCVILISVGAIVDAIAQNRTTEGCGIQVSEKGQPWLVGIEFEGVDATTFVVQCTGALINRRHVVSNAECFDNNEKPRWVQLGPNITTNGKFCPTESSDDSCNDDGITRSPIELVVRHPEYSPDSDWSSTGGSHHDIALIRLRDVITYTDGIRPICLPDADVTQLLPTDRELHLAGLYFGVPDDYNLEYLGAAMTYLDREAYRSNSNQLMVAEDHISAETTTTLTRFPACMLNGGLLVNKRKGTYELVGLLEYTSACSPAKLFTHFYLYLDWIRSVTPDWAPCGRRRVEHVELIVNAADTKAGDWPWHVALYRLNKSKFTYICGGTLISKTMVLTAAHCVTISGRPVSPDIMSVTLGKYYLLTDNIESQEIKVLSVIAHEGYSPKNYLENDIALLKLKNEATYSDYVQPACIWYSEAYARLPTSKVDGTVVGWGFDESDTQSSQLKQANMPKVSNTICIEKNPPFYANVLSNNKKFCAGWANGTSPCNGDSGGGYLIFVPDKAKTDSTDAPGSWYIRGIVSMTISLKNHARCDPYQYVVFTDVEKYIDWIQKYLDN